MATSSYLKLFTFDQNEVLKILSDSCNVSDRSLKYKENIIGISRACERNTNSKAVTMHSQWKCELINDLCIIVTFDD